MFGSREKEKVEFRQLDHKGGRALVGSREVDFEFKYSNAYFSLEHDGQIGVYTIEQDTHGITIPQLKAIIGPKAPPTNGELSSIYRELNKAYMVYAERENAIKNSKLEEIMKTS